MWSVSSTSSAFWLQREQTALFRWFRLTTIQAHLQAEALLMGTLLDGLPT
ncbi:hypothetical protein [Nostoc sp.]